MICNNYTSPFNCRKNIQIHSFVLTNIDSKWRFGFCRHDPKSETAMIILTLLPWHDMFIKFLKVLGDIKRTAPINEFKKFLTLAYDMGVPAHGASKKLFYEAGNVGSTMPIIKLSIKFKYFLYSLLSSKDPMSSHYHLFQKM